MKNIFTTLILLMVILGFNSKITAQAVNKPSIMVFPEDGWMQDNNYMIDVNDQGTIKKQPDYATAHRALTLRVAHPVEPGCLADEAGQAGQAWGHHLVVLEAEERRVRECERGVREDGWMDGWSREVLRASLFLQPSTTHIKRRWLPRAGRQV